MSNLIREDQAELQSAEQALKKEAAGPAVQPYLGIRIRKQSAGRDRRARRPVVYRVIRYSQTARSRGRGIPTHDLKCEGSTKSRLGYIPR